MTKLTQEERDAFESLDRGALRQPDLPDEERFVLPNPEARLEYILFATEASRFYRGQRKVGFRGNRWLL